jgi:non-structural maintenance of chromosomes element 1
MLKVARPARSRSSMNRNDDETQAAQSADKGLKHSEVLTLLPNLVSEGWLEKSREGFYSLSPRALLELWPWLNASYNDLDGDADAADTQRWLRVKHCEACMEIVTVGQRCSERDCPGRLHDICLEAFFRAQRAERCPKCRRAWDGKHFVGERAVTETEAFKKARGGRGRRSDLVEAIMAQNRDDEEDDEEEE